MLGTDALPFSLSVALWSLSSGSVATLGAYREQDEAVCLTPRALGCFSSSAGFCISTTALASVF